MQRLKVRERTVRVYGGGMVALQAGIAAVTAWLLSHELIGNPSPVFAPLAAVGTLAVSVGQRVRRIVELVVGVALGVLVGSALLSLIGTGPWQLGLVVVLSILTSFALSSRAAVVIQTASTAVLITTLGPQSPNVELSRFVDALLGGSVALATAILLPVNPLRVVRRAAGPALRTLVEQLTETAEALCERDIERAIRARTRLRGNQEELRVLREAVAGAREVTQLSPLSWRHRHGVLSHYARTAEPLERAMGSSGTLIRRAVTVIEDREPVSAAMINAVLGLAEAVRILRDEFAARKEPHDARAKALQAVHHAGAAYKGEIGFSGTVVLAQIRTTASDLLVASGLSQAEANSRVRCAFGRLPEQSQQAAHSGTVGTSADQPRRSRPPGRRTRRQATRTRRISRLVSPLDAAARGDQEAGSPLPRKRAEWGGGSP
ncbi:aromatic acid exporter family protein [Micromonospora sp. U21]|uniref:FUSC family protein n=1 Tax=Micromonospora sp. U21 TaxID=2824899 RepID=UPI001B397CDE|nr:FUSC family protein [Micromonospora sp. U21]MBQ0904164.1 FUSC family protein [Micromonospora sp. U21]